MKLVLLAIVMTLPWTLSCDNTNSDATDSSLIDSPELDSPTGDAAAPVTCTPVTGTDVRLMEIATGLNSPVFLAAPAGDDRLFVIEQPGRIRVIKNGALLPTPFLDLTSRVEDGLNEQGLLGLAFHPDFASNGKFYVNYTAKSPSWDTVVAEYTASAGSDTANFDERRLLVIDQFQWNHNGGMLAFGPDGFLYIGVGDGGGGSDPNNHGQNRNTLLATILRIDIDGADPGLQYAIPMSNPYVDQAGADEVWLYGLRNPWRFSFDSANGDLYIGDVGQCLWEEIHVLPSASTGGENLGWPIAEGNNRCLGTVSACIQGDGCSTTGMEPATVEYSHGGGRCSVTGGYVYRGSCLPDLQGHYFYADFCSNQVWSIQYPNNTTPQSWNFSGGSLQGITSFGVDNAGELYILSRGNGTVYKLVADS